MKRGLLLTIVVACAVGASRASASSALFDFGKKSENLIDGDLTVGGFDSTDFEFSGSFLSSIAINRFLGVNVGNGGHAVICRLVGETSSRIEALDLFEGRARGYTYKPVNGDSLLAALKLAEPFDATLPAPLTGLRERMVTFSRDVRFNEPGDTPRTTTDTGEISGPLERCQLIQVINFGKKNGIRASADVWGQLDETSKAAFFLHESIYWFLRDGRVENDSRRTRKIVSLLMSGRTLKPFNDFSDIGPGAIQRCRSLRISTELGLELESPLFGPRSDFYTYRDRQGRTTLQFVAAGGYRMMTKTVVKGKADGALTPIIDRNGKGGKLTGRIESQIDGGGVISVHWGKLMGTNLGGMLQPNSPLSETVSCSPIEKQDLAKATGAEL